MSMTLDREPETHAADSTDAGAAEPVARRPAAARMGRRAWPRNLTSTSWSTSSSAGVWPSPFRTRRTTRSSAATSPASTRANARCLRSVIAGEIALEDVYLEQVLSFAKVQAQLRIPQKSMQRSYRISFFTMWEAWSAHLRQAIVERDVDRDEAALAPAAADPDHPGLPGLRRLSGRRDLHPRLRGAEPVPRAYAPQPRQGHPARRERGAVRLGRGDPRPTT